MTDSLRLFLIEDEEDVALLIRKSLERASHHVTCCRTAADALIVLGQSSFDLVILDQKLPDMKGLDLLQLLTREGINTPVLMVTAYGNENLAILCFGPAPWITSSRTRPWPISANCPSASSNR